jgi:hypothetical protein
MQNRIEINGIWYVREDKQHTPVIDEIDDEDVVDTLSCTWETDEFCFDATVILRDNAEELSDFYGSPFLKITDKRPSDRKDWIEHEVDNSLWFLGVLEGNPDSMEEAKEMFNDNGIQGFQRFISYLIQKGWLSESK